MSKNHRGKKAETKTSKKTIVFLLIIFCVAMISTIKFFKKSSSSGFGLSALAKVKGSDKAPIQITEYIDFECHSCAKGAKYLKDIMIKHPGMLRVELKHFPLKMHKNSVLAARYAECAARQDIFWPYHDNLVMRQNNWKRLEDAEPAFEVIAKDVGLDLKNLRSCLQDESVDEAIQENKAKGKALGVKSTPTYFINRKMVVGIKSLKLKLDKELDEKKN